MKWFQDHLKSQLQIPCNKQTVKNIKYEKNILPYLNLFWKTMVSFWMEMEIKE